MRSIEVFVTFLFLLVSFTAADKHCTKDCQRDADPANLWYVWLILVFIAFMLGCGFLATCIKMCCKPNKPPVPIFESHPLEVTVISMDHQSTMDGMSRVSSFNDSHPLHPFTNAMDNSFNPPPYNLYTLDSLPQYDEAMTMPTNTLAVIGGNTEDYGEFHQSCVFVGGPMEFTQLNLGREGLQVIPDIVVFDEEEPPAYSTVVEGEFNEIDLDELDPTESRREDTGAHKDNA